MPPKRLSVDLDFDYIGQIEREQMLEDRPNIETAIIEISRRLDYRVQRSADAFAGRKLFLQYRSELGQNERIEIDLNFIFRVPFAGIEVLQLWQPGELDRPSIQIVGLMELVIGKLLAMLDRGAVRDVWDVANLPKKALDVLKDRSFRARFIALSAILDHPPEILFPGVPEESEKFAVHPAVLWKVANVRSHLEDRKYRDHG